MECAEIRNSFMAGRVPAGPPVEVHLAACPHCHELFQNDARLGRRLAQAVLPEAPAGDLFALVERDLNQEVGLRARLRELPLGVRVAALSGVAGALFVFQFVRNRRSDFGGYSPAVFWGLALALAVAFVVGVLNLSRGATAPLRSWGRGRVAAVLLLLFPALVAVLAPLGASLEAEAPSDGPSSCFSYGAALVVPLVLLYWLFERRDTVPWRALAAAGAVVGLAANLLLHVHCGSVHAGHLLLGHASIGVVWALALRLVWGSPASSR